MSTTAATYPDSQWRMVPRRMRRQQDAATPRRKQLKKARWKQKKAGANGIATTAAIKGLHTHTEKKRPKKE